MSNPRLERLRTDYQRLQELAARSPFIRILSVQGSPPMDYTLQFTCRGVERLDNNGNPVYREDHRMRIVLGPQYPLAKPAVQCLTPIFHPNISSSGSVCIGREWSSGGRYLDDLVIYLMQMVRYDGEGLTFTPDAFNPAAYQWATQNRRLLPVDRRPMFGLSWAEQIKVHPYPSSQGPQQSPGSLDIRVHGQDELDIRVHDRS